MTMNVRSLMKNKAAMALVLEQESPAVLCLQETWLSRPAPNLHDDYDRMQSVLKRNEGVATYTKKIIAAKAFLKEEWSSTLMMVRVGDLIIMNVYVSEGWKNEILNTVSRLSRQCVTDGLNVMVMGDFNLIPNEMSKVARKNELKLCPSPSEGTREGRNGSRNTLDYVMHDFEMEVTAPVVVP